MTATKHPARKLSPFRQKLEAAARMMTLAESIFSDRELAVPTFKPDTIVADGTIKS